MTKNNRQSTKRSRGQPSVGNERVHVEPLVGVGRLPDEPPEPKQDPRLEIPEVLKERRAEKTVLSDANAVDGRSDRGETYSAAARAWGMGFDFISTILVGVFLGWLLDRWITPSPAGVMGGLGVGFVLAFMRIIKASARESQAQMARYQAHHHDDKATGTSGTDSDLQDD